jgi:ribosomal protein L13
MFEKQVIIDGRGHLLGRLSSIVAKELLLGCVFFPSPLLLSLVAAAR